jgi:hypothetical protein
MSGEWQYHYVPSMALHLIPPHVLEQSYLQMKQIQLSPRFSYTTRPFTASLVSLSALYFGKMERDWQNQTSSSLFNLAKLSPQVYAYLHVSPEAGRGMEVVGMVGFYA